MKRIKKLVVALILCFCMGFISSGTELQTNFLVDVQAATTVAAPKLVSAKPSGTTKAVIKWKAVKGASGYRVYRSTNGKSWKSVKTIAGANNISYTDSKLTMGTRYYYTVKAYKKVNGKAVWSSYDKKGLNMIAGLQSLKLNKSSVTIYKGSSYTLKINGTKLKPSWKSSASSIASVNSAGKVTAKKNGTATITATLDGRKLTCKVTVKTKTASTTTATYYTKLKNYLIKYGSTNSNGDKFIKVQDKMDDFYYTWAIIYEKAKDNYCFMMTTENGDISSLVDMNVNVQKSGYANSDYMIVYESADAAFQTAAKFPAKNYNGKSDISFSVVKTTGHFSNSTMSELSNSALQAGFVGWEVMLNEYVGISMKNLGFTSYSLN